MTAAGDGSRTRRYLLHHHSLPPRPAPPPTDDTGAYRRARRCICPGTRDPVVKGDGRQCHAASERRPCPLASHAAVIQQQFCVSAQVELKAWALFEADLLTKWTCTSLSRCMRVCWGWHWHSIFDAHQIQRDVRCVVCLDACRMALQPVIWLSVTWGPENPPSSHFGTLEAALSQTEVRTDRHAPLLSCCCFCVRDGGWLILPWLPCGIPPSMLCPAGGGFSVLGPPAGP